MATGPGDTGLAEVQITDVQATAMQMETVDA